eukprot:TRINITY_DN1764_c0_g1_i3.p1 TRINITY_DN1764_c0_g1~~TRINITY_DN1764_c0_g1_i3.p1  ORF type:complete len:156 (-),score=28.57 TRINITY_DN1764_c0_g1_i3:185-622(-)
MVGVFPDNHVEVIDALKTNSVGRGEAIVVLEYHAKAENQLSLQTGQVVKILTKFPTGWWKGVVDDKVGIFPDYVVKEGGGTGFKPSKTLCDPLGVPGLDLRYDELKEALTKLEQQTEEAFNGVFFFFKKCGNSTWVVFAKELISL